MVGGVALLPIWLKNEGRGMVEPNGLALGNDEFMAGQRQARVVGFHTAVQRSTRDCGSSRPTR